MYMNGRGPMMGGHRGPMGGPGMGFGPRMGFVPGMGFRPMRVHRRPMGFFPMGGLFILPALMFGGWIVVAVLAGVLSLVGTVIGGIFSGLSSLGSDAFSGGGLVIGVILGVLAFYYIRNRKAKNESAGSIDGEKAEIEIEEPAHWKRM